MYERKQVDVSNIILPILSTAIFSVLIEVIWYMHDATTQPRGNAVWCNIVAIQYSTVQY